MEKLRPRLRQLYEVYSPTRAQRLRRLLIESMEQAQCLVLVAGPGYGKTGAMAELAQVAAGPSYQETPIWFTITPEDVQAKQFVHRLRESVGNVFGWFYPAPGLSNSRWYQINNNIGGLLCILTRAACERRVVLFFDNVDLLADSPDAQRVLKELIAGSPRSVQFVLASRVNPTWVKEVTETYTVLGQHALRYTPEEVEEAFAGIPLAPQAQNLLSAVEGWPLGILALHRGLLRRRPAAWGRIRSFLTRYLQRTVVAHLAADLRRFATECSVLPVLDPALCHELGYADADGKIESLQNDHPLVLTDARGRPRFVRIFREVLLEELRSDLAHFRHLHQVAARALARKSGLVQGCREYLEVQHHVGVAMLLREAHAHFQATGDVQSLRSMLEMVPEGIFAESPDLWLIRGDAELEQGRVASAIQCYEAALASAACSSVQGPACQARALLARARAEQMAGRVEIGLRLVADNFAMLKENGGLQLGQAWLGLGQCQVRMGLLADAERSLRTAYQLYSRSGCTEEKVSALVARALGVELRQGALRKCRESLEQAERLASEATPRAQLLAQAARVYALALTGYTEDAASTGRQVLKAASERGLLHLEAQLKVYLSGTQSLQAAEMPASKTPDGDQLLSVEALLAQSCMEEQQGNLEAAEAVAGLALARARQIRDPWLVGRSLVRMAWIRLALTHRLLSPGLAHSSAAHMYTATTRALLAEARLLTESLGDELHRTAAALGEACLALWSPAGTGEAFDSLAQTCLSRIRSGGYEQWLTLLDSRCLTDFLTAALARGIEPEFTQSLLRRVQGFNPRPDPPAGSVAQPGAAPSGSAPLGRVQPGSVPLAVCLFGTFSVAVNGRQVSEAQWRRKKAKALLKYLILHSGTQFSADHLVELFWSGLPVKQAVSNLHVTVHFLRHLLQPGLSSGSHSRYIVRRDDRYSFELSDACWVDTHEFLAASRLARQSAAKGERDKALSYSQKMIELYKKGLLAEDLYESWLESLRPEFERYYCEALHRLSAAAFDAGRFAECVEWLQRVLEVDPYAEQAHARIIEAYLQMGARHKAVGQYKLCRQLLRDDLGIEPGAELRRLRLLILEESKTCDIPRGRSLEEVKQEPAGTPHQPHAR